IAMPVRDDDGVDRIPIDTEVPHRHEARRTAIDQQATRSPCDVKAGVETTTSAERIAAPKKLELHADCSLVPLFLRDCYSREPAAWPSTSEHRDDIRA